jgi:hypothetical protein
MNFNPDIEQLKNCIAAMASDMNMKGIPDELSNKLIHHILYNEEYNGLKGKNVWSSFCEKLITEKETRNLLMAHCSTKIAKFNKLKEPSFDSYASIALYDMFEVALFNSKPNS